MTRSILLALVLAATSVACGAEGEVARIDGFIVKDADIACPADASPEACAAIRQEKFNRLAQPLLVDAAAKIHRISITDAELNQFTVKVPDAHLRAADERLKRLARATLLVRRGEDVDAVYLRDLAPHGVTKEQFQGVMTAYPDEATALRALSVDVGAETRRQFNQQARRRLAEQKLSRVVDEQSKQNGVAFEVAAQRFWGAVVDRSDCVVFDESLHLPAMEGVLRP
jgi:hypothetical protein